MADREVSEFDAALDQRLGLANGGEALFGRDVLAGLVDGIAAAQRAPTSRYRLGPVVLGCAMTMDDPELIGALEQTANACVVITKQERRRHAQSKWKALEGLSQAHGLMASAFPELEDLAPRDDQGRPRLVGPGDPDWRDHMDIGAVREVGFRKTGDHLVPIVHAKLVLLGHLWWTDEHPSGHVVETFGFQADRLWVSSANFTVSSRRSLEVGLWSEDPKLLVAARRFLIGLVELSEPLGQGPDRSAPELLPVQYDDEAMWAAVEDARAPLEQDQ